MTLRATLPAALAGICLAASLVSPAAALDRKVQIMNKTGYTIMEFYGSNTGTNDWEEDIFGSDILPNGRTMNINFDDGSGYCKFDFKAVFDDGDVIVSRDINICELTTYTYN